MSNRILPLSDAVTHMIAAGEVVEGPFSVVKELIENAVDADAKHIIVEVEDSGFKRIMVRDDGSGIYRDDIPLAVQEHATSKIRDITDISEISSYGFRGEALSSIGAISSLTILSRREDEQFGGRLESRNGSFTIADYAGPVGTTVIVENLFYNTPARKKFMKSLSAESRAIRETVLRAAIPMHEISFTLVANGKTVLSCDRVKSRQERIAQLFGTDEMDSLIHETITDISVQVEGFVSKPHCPKASRSMQYLYVNNRPVDIKHYSFLLTRGYESAIPQGKYPAAIVFVTIRPDLTDVNIHPAKREIKFFDQRYVESLIFGLVKKAVSSREHEILARDFSRDDISHTETIPPSLSGEFSSSSMIREIQKEISFPKADSPGRLDSEIISDSAQTYEINTEYRILGVIFSTYIIIERNDELVVIDFHAAHERMNYDMIISSAGSIDTQTLLFPEIIELGQNQFQRAIELVDDLNNRGFDIEQFSEDSIVVRAVPSIIKGGSISDFVKDIIETYDNDVNRLDHRIHIIASRVACHASRRAGDQLTNDEMNHLAERIFSGEYKLVCPHGRPYIYTMKRGEFEKLFRR